MNFQALALFLPGPDSDGFSAVKNGARIGNGSPDFPLPRPVLLKNPAVPLVQIRVVSSQKKQLLVKGGLREKRSVVLGENKGFFSGQCYRLQFFGDGVPQAVGLLIGCSMPEPGDFLVREDFATRLDPGFGGGCKGQSPRLRAGYSEIRRQRTGIGRI